MFDSTVAALALITRLLAPTEAHADVSIGINLNVPPPPVIVTVAPPQLVAVPNSPVFYAPSVAFNMFVFAGRYYSFHDGVWFTAATHKGPWTAVGRDRVPKAVLAVPVSYYKVPPGHAKKTHGQPAVGHAKNDDHLGKGRGKGKKGHGD